jgi:hypothetical protein
MKTKVASAFSWEGWPIDTAQVRTINHMQFLGTTLVPDGPLLDRAEVAAFRADTAWERVRLAAEVNRLLWSSFVHAEDSGIPEGCTWSDNCGYLSKSFG